MFNDKKNIKMFFSVMTKNLNQEDSSYLLLKDGMGLMMKNFNIAGVY